MRAASKRSIRRAQQRAQDPDPYGIAAFSKMASELAPWASTLEDLAARAALGDAAAAQELGRLAAEAQPVIEGSRDFRAVLDRIERACLRARRG